MVETKISEMKEITPEDSVVPVYLVPLTAEEEAKREQWLVEQLEIEAIEAAKLQTKQTAISKLKKLGLTEDEAKAIIGVS